MNTRPRPSTGFESAEEWILPPERIKVLPVLILRFALIVSALNCLLWLIAFILQVVLLGGADSKFGAGYTMVCITTCFSILLVISTAVSIYGLVQNTLKEIQSYLVVKAICALLSLIIFILNVVVLTLESTFDDWQAACGFSVFTGLYFFGESLIMLKFLTDQWRHFRTDLEEERMDRIRQALERQKREQLEVLTRSSIHQLAPDATYDSSSHNGPFVIDLEDGSDRLTFTPPVFV